MIGSFFAVKRSRARAATRHLAIPRCPDPSWRETLEVGPMHADKGSGPPCPSLGVLRIAHWPLAPTAVPPLPPAAVRAFPSPGLPFASKQMPLVRLQMRPSSLTHRHLRRHAHSPAAAAIAATVEFPYPLISLAGRPSQHLSWDPLEPSAPSPILVHSRTRRSNRSSGNRRRAPPCPLAGHKSVVGEP